MDDILLDEDFDLLTGNGDFVAGDATGQHQKCLLLADKGSYRQFPTSGVGMATFLKDENPNDLLREIRIEFTKDGMDVQKLGFESGKIQIIAPYI